MKRRHYLFLAIILVGLAFSAWFLTHPRQLPEEECSDTYRRYKDVEGVAASFIKGFPVNDTLSLDVTTLQATDSAGWERLKKDFNISPIPPEVQAFVGQAQKNVVFKRIPIDRCAQEKQETIDYSCLLIAIQDDQRTISVFVVENDILAKAIHRNKMSELIQ